MKKRTPFGNGGEKMDKLIDNPWFLRFTALLLAIVLFISVKTDEVNRDKTATGDRVELIRDVPVEVYYDSENLVVTGVPETVNVTIDGPANLVQSTKLLKDFTLKVDLQQLPLGEHKVEIQHENLSDKLKVRIDPAFVHVVLEEKVTQTFRVDPEMNERLLAEDYQIVKMEVEPATIQVTGAKSVVESIQFVKVSVTGEEGITKSFEQRNNVRILDRDLNKLNVQVSPEKVNVKVEIEEYNKEVPISLLMKGTPPTDVAIHTMTTPDNKIRLYGPRSVLDTIQEFIVEVDVSTITGAEEIDVEVKKPKGVTKVSKDQINVKIDATVTDAERDQNDVQAAVDSQEVQEVKEFKAIPVVIKEMNPKYKGTFTKPANGEITVSVSGTKTVIDRLEQQDFTVYVDASTVNELGEYTLRITVDGPQKLKWQLSQDEVTMKVELA